MLYVKTDENLNIIVYPYNIANLSKDYPQTSFSENIDLESLSELNIYVVEPFEFPKVETNKKLIHTNPILENGIWKQQFYITDKTEEEIVSEYTMRSKNIRQKRNKLLLESDWVVAKAYELGTEVPQEWKEYRQALRDIPSQENFPFEVVFPQFPTV